MREGKEVAECRRDDRLGDSDSESQSGVETSSEEAVSGQENGGESKNGGLARVERRNAMTGDAAVMEGTVSRGKKRNRSEFFMTGRDSDGKTKRSDSCNGRQGKGFGKRSPYKPRKRKEGDNSNDNQQLHSSSEVVAAQLDNSKLT